MIIFNLPQLILYKMIRIPSISASIALFISPICAYKINTHKKYIAPDAIMKNYFAARMNMSNVDIVNIFSHLKRQKVPKSFFNDHRWLHLVMKVEKNMSDFVVNHKMSILQSLVKIRCYDDLFKNIIDSLMANQQQLCLDEQTLLLYFMAKSGKARVQYIQILCDSILKKLSQPIVITYKNNELRMKETQGKQGLQGSQQGEIERQQMDLQFESQFGLKNQFSNNQVQFRNLILALWALPKLRIADKMLVKVIINDFLKKSLQSIPTQLLPLVLSVLWTHRLQNKRIFPLFLNQIPFRKNQIQKLDGQKLIMLVCMACKSDKTHQSIILWLMETILLSFKGNHIYIGPISAYRILINSFKADVFEENLYLEYLTIICSNLTKIKINQIVYCLQIMCRINKNKTHQISKILLQSLNQNLQQFLSVNGPQTKVRMVLRNLIFRKKIQVTSYYQKMLMKEERQSRKGQKMEQKIDINQNIKKNQTNSVKN